MVHEHAAEHSSANGWQRFWDRGGWWKAVLVSVGYLVVYEGVQFILAPVLAPLVSDDIFADTTSVLVGLVFPLVIGAIALTVFCWSVGWLPRPLFGRQPVRGRWWMWPAPILVVVAAVGHFVGADFSRYQTGVIVGVLVAGLLVGFTEELLTRGIGVTLLRRGGYREWAVMAMSSVIFASLHLTNLLGGQPLGTVLPTVVYTFGFGICMYLTLRLGGRLIWPILLHAMTDPATMLSSGGIDESHNAGTNTGNLLASIATIAYYVFALVAFIVTRGDANGRAEADERATVRAETQE